MLEGGTVADDEPDGGAASVLVVVAVAVTPAACCDVCCCICAFSSLLIDIFWSLCETRTVFMWYCGSNAAMGGNSKIDATRKLPGHGRSRDEDEDVQDDGEAEVAVEGVDADVASLEIEDKGRFALEFDGGGEMISTSESSISSDSLPFSSSSSSS